MGVGEVSVTRLDVNGWEQATDVVGCGRGRPQALKETGWWGAWFLTLALGFLTYDCYLAWQISGKLLPLITSLPATDAAVVVTVIQVFALLLLPLLLAIVSVNRRGDMPWFMRSAAMCLLGLLTALLEACAYVVG